MYGPDNLSRDHPVIDHLIKEGRVASLAYFKEGFESIEAQYPFLVTLSVKQGSGKQ